MQGELSRTLEATANAGKFMKVVRKYTSFEELTPTLLREFVEKIVIHESEAPDGKRRGKLRRQETNSQRYHTDGYHLTAKLYPKDGTSIKMGHPDAFLMEGGGFNQVNMGDVYKGSVYGNSPWARRLEKSCVLTFVSGTNDKVGTDVSTHDFLIVRNIALCYH